MGMDSDFLVSLIWEIKRLAFSSEKTRDTPYRLHLRKTTIQIINFNKVINNDIVLFIYRTLQGRSPAAVQK